MIFVAIDLHDLAVLHVSEAVLADLWVVDVHDVKDKAIPGSLDFTESVGELELLVLYDSGVLLGGLVLAGVGVIDRVVERELAVREDEVLEITETAAIGALELGKLGHDIEMLHAAIFLYSLVKVSAIGMLAHTVNV